MTGALVMIVINLFTLSLAALAAEDAADRLTQMGATAFVVNFLAGVIATGHLMLRYFGV